MISSVRTAGISIAIVSSLTAALLAAEPAGSIDGKVLDAQGAAVEAAYVVLCDQASGVPLVAESYRTMTDELLAGRPPMDLAFATSDESGRFSFDKLPPGEYRLIAQSWKDAASIKGLLEVNSREIQLHGVAERIRVTAGAQAEATIRPLGTGSLQLEEEMPNDETLLLLSTAPPRADPILAFPGWGGPMMQNLIGGNRMPKGATTVHGLPEGTVHLVLFAADDSPGFGAGSVEIKPGETSFTYVPLVAGWSDGHHDPPKRLEPLCDEVRRLKREGSFSLPELFKKQGIELDSSGGMWRAYQQTARHLDDPITLPSGTKTTFADLVAAVQYVKLQDRARNRKQPNQQPTEAEREVSYEEAFRDLHDHLGSRYPCFELKDIDWKAVGDELLPRAKDVETDEQFGLLCMELVARLEDSHAMLGSGTQRPPTPEFPRWDPGLACLVDDRGKPVVYYVDRDGPAKAAGVEVGMTVVSIDGISAEAAMKDRMQKASKYAGYSSQRYLRYHAAQWLARQTQRGATVKLQMEGPDGKLQEFNLPATLGVRYLPRLPVPIAGISDTANVSWTMLDGRIGYIYVRRIRDDLIEQLDRAVAELKDAKGLIVDVRGNSGGGFDFARSHRNFSPEEDQEPDRPRFAGPMALLIDSRCISAGEGWASWFIANRRARIFGEATAGASARKETYRLKNGLYQVTFPVKAYRGYLDRPIERRGLEPDVPLRQNARDLAAGRDTVLTAAKEYLLRE